MRGNTNHPHPTLHKHKFNLQEGDEELEAVPLNLKSVEGVFFVTVYGMALACIFVVVEMFLHNVKESVREKRSLKNALREEIKFYLKFGENVKPVHAEEEDEGGSGEEKVGEVMSNGSPPPMGFIIDRKPEENGARTPPIGFVFDSRSSGQDSKRSKSKKSNGRSNTRST